jgi:hypothetical protein
MQVYQSTMSKFAKRLVENGETRYGYRDFDREGWGVAQATNYDPTRASHPKLTSPRLAGDKTIERVFRGKTTLGQGSPKAAVTKIQQLLVERGYDLGDFGPAKDGVDGKYGDKAVEAIKQFRGPREPRQPVERPRRPRRDPAARRAVPALAAAHCGHRRASALLHLLGPDVLDVRRERLRMPERIQQRPKRSHQIASSSGSIVEIAPASTACLRRRRPPRRT